MNVGFGGMVVAAMVFTVVWADVLMLPARRALAMAPAQPLRGIGETGAGRYHSVGA